MAHHCPLKHQEQGLSVREADSMIRVVDSLTHAHQVPEAGRKVLKTRAEALDGIAQAEQETVHHEQARLKIWHVYKEATEEEELQVEHQPPHVLTAEAGEVGGRGEAGLEHQLDSITELGRAAGQLLVGGHQDALRLVADGDGCRRQGAAMVARLQHLNPHHAQIHRKLRQGRDCSAAAFFGQADGDLFLRQVGLRGGPSGYQAARGQPVARWSHWRPAGC